LRFFVGLIEAPITFAIAEDGRLSSMTVYCLSFSLQEMTNYSTTLPELPLGASGSHTPLSTMKTKK